MKLCITLFFQFTVMSSLSLSLSLCLSLSLSLVKISSSAPLAYARITKPLCIRRFGLLEVINSIAQQSV
jgi:hypothetical protein